ncbi:MAG: TIGR02206 family membrane protein [Phycisphaerales bacterium JB063]
MPVIASESVFTPASHVAMLFATAWLVFSAAALGRVGCEKSVRWSLAVLGVLVWIGSGLFFSLWPTEMGEGGGMKLEESLPIQACDLLALLAPVSLVVGSKWLRAIVYFGAVGLTTQAFLTPVIDTGPDTLRFWVFWAVHISILVCAMFELIAGGYRPDVFALLRAVAFWAVYAVAMVILDAYTGWYYGYLGPEIPETAEDSILQYLGDWPVRPAVMMGVVLAIFVVIWLPWGLVRLVHRSDES